MIESVPIVNIGDMLISNAAKTFSEAIGIVVRIEKENNVYRRSQYVYTVLWNDISQPINHTEDEVRRWRDKYLDTRKKHGI